MNKVGRGVWVQTPAHSFLVEPHLMAPLLHWFPVGWQRRLIRSNRGRVAALFMLSLALLAPAKASGQSFPFTGDATYYGPIDGGNCSFGVIPSAVSPFLKIVAFGTPIYADSSPCGRFIEIDTSTATCAAPPCDFTGDRVVVMVSDQLPSGSPNLDLSLPAFTELAHPDEGLLLGVRWRYVPGDHAGDIELHNTVGINPFFIHFVLQKHNFGITAVSVRDAVDPTWHVASRDIANQWSVSTGQTFQAPLSVRIKDVNGTVVTATDAVTSLAPSAVFDLGVQFNEPAAVPSGSLAGPLSVLTIGWLGTTWLRRRSARPGNREP